MVSKVYKDMSAFDNWWCASKYCQVVNPKCGWRQIALDGWDAANSQQIKDLQETQKLLVSALERIQYNYELTLAGKPVRDVSETLAECDNALKEAKKP